MLAAFSEESATGAMWYSGRPSNRPRLSQVPGDRHKGRREYRSRDPRAPRPGGCSESCRCGGIHGRYHRYGHALSVHDIQTRPDPDILSG